jgi:thioredoxin-like negative regulator of GroEL
MMEIQSNSLLYFWNSSCSVCGPLYEKLEFMVQNDFPNIHIQKINIAENPENSSKFSVFSAPLIILLLDGKEYLRSGGNISLHEIKQKIHRLYQLKFEN